MNTVESMRELWLNTVDAQENNKPVCLHCGKEFIADIGEAEYCSESCWHLDRVGEVKKQILAWIAHGYDEQKILSNLRLYWFFWMSDSTVARWKRAVAAKFNFNVGE